MRISLKKKASSNIVLRNADEIGLQFQGYIYMSIRDIAQDLYRLQQKVEMIGRKLETAPAAKKADIEDQLRKAKAERRRLRRILDGQLDR